MTDLISFIYNNLRCNFLVPRVLHIKVQMCKLSCQKNKKKRKCSYFELGTQRRKLHYTCSREGLVSKYLF